MKTILPALAALVLCGCATTNTPSAKTGDVCELPGEWKIGLVGYGQNDRDTTTWTRGEEGVSFYVFCRGREDGANGLLRLRKLTFDKEGRFVKVGAEEVEYGLIPVSQITPANYVPLRKQYVGHTDTDRWFIDNRGTISREPTCLPEDLKSPIPRNEFDAWTNSFINARIQLPRRKSSSNNQ